MVQLDDIQTFSDPTPLYHSSGSNLLKKFDIPLQHLDFEYVNNCKDAEELEKILQILKSGEEGYYPQLTERTEQRLTELKPNSKYIRKTVKVLNRNDLNQEKYEKISNDLTKWLTDINKKNEELETFRNKSNKNIPEIRKCKSLEVEDKKKTVSNRIKSIDYAAWDKYDVETELLKMDLEDKKAKMEAEKLPNKSSKKNSVKFNPFLTTAEAVFEAQRESEKGNEYFKAKEYETSIEYYNNSILYHRTAMSFKNRGSAYMAMKKYEKAINDYNEALNFDQNDFEALLRTAQCYQHLKKYDEAAHFTDKAVRLNPNDSNVQKLAGNVRKNMNATSSKVRMKISNVSEKPEQKKNVGVKKSILKKEEKIIIPIPGTSKMSGPYYKVVDPKDLPDKNVQHNKSNKSKKDDSKQKTIEMERKKVLFEQTDMVNDKSEQQNFVLEQKKVNCDQNKIDSEQKKVVIEQTTVESSDKTVETTEKKVTKELQSKIVELQLQNEANEKRPTEITMENNLVQESRRPIPREQVHRSSEIQDIKAGGEPYTVSSNEDISPEQIRTPYSFVQSWLTARKENNYVGFAKIIRNLNVDRLTEVIGNKLDATMLSEILNCLYRHFTVAHEVEKVYNLLMNLCQIDRFNIIIMFLSKEDKVLLHNLINYLKQHGEIISDDILRQYNLQ